MKILRDPAVKEMTGLSRVTRWRLESENNFPKRVQLGKRAIGWKDFEIQEWCNSRPCVVLGGQVK